MLLLAKLKLNKQRNNCQHTLIIYSEGETGGWSESVCVSTNRVNNILQIVFMRSLLQSICVKSECRKLCRDLYAKHTHTLRMRNVRSRCQLPALNIHSLCLARSLALTLRLFAIKYLLA